MLKIRSQWTQVWRLKTPETSRVKHQFGLSCDPLPAALCSACCSGKTSLWLVQIYCRLTFFIARCSPRSLSCLSQVSESYLGAEEQQEPCLLGCSPGSCGEGRSPPIPFASPKQGGFPGGWRLAGKLLEKDWVCVSLWKSVVKQLGLSAPGPPASRRRLRLGYAKGV